MLLKNPAHACHTITLELSLGASCPPNYEIVEKGDAAERVWTLSLDGSAACGIQGDQDQPAETDVKKIQLLFATGEMYDKYRSELGKPVIVVGDLDHASRGHHHTHVILQVTDIEPY